MITLEQYRYVQQMRKTGVPVSRIAKDLGWSQQKADYWARQSEEYFLYSLGVHSGPYDSCRQFLVDTIRLCPEISTANLMQKVSEAYPKITIVKNNFYTYVKNLRNDINIQKTGKRITTLKAESEPGYEAQVDFGSYRMKNMYGLNVKVYFFTMQLSYTLSFSSLKTERR